MHKFQVVNDYFQSLQNFLKNTDLKKLKINKNDEFHAEISKNFREFRHFIVTS